MWVQPMNLLAGSGLSTKNLPVLSKRDLQILGLIAEEAGNDEIADCLGIASSSAAKYKSNIYKKLGYSKNISYRDKIAIAKSYIESARGLSWGTLAIPKMNPTTLTPSEPSDLELKIISIIGTHPGARAEKICSILKVRKENIVDKLRILAKRQIIYRHYKASNHCSEWYLTIVGMFYHKQEQEISRRSQVASRK